MFSTCEILKPSLKDREKQKQRRYRTKITKTIGVKFNIHKNLISSVIFQNIDEYYLRKYAYQQLAK